MQWVRRWAATGLSGTADDIHGTRATEHAKWVPFPVCVTKVGPYRRMQSIDFSFRFSNDGSSEHAAGKKWW